MGYFCRLPVVTISPVYFPARTDSGSIDMNSAQEPFGYDTHSSNLYLNSDHVLYIGDVKQCTPPIVQSGVQSMITMITGQRHYIKLSAMDVAAILEGRGTI